MSNKKTIQINPQLFKLPGNKTRKNKDKKDLILKPIVTPNTIKSNLLKRIKEHKSKEIKSNISEQEQEQENVTDEFYGALNYLSGLSKQQKVNEVKQRILNTKTLKNYDNTYTNVSLDLPIELQETNISSPNTNNVFNINYKQIDDIPYGCLKNGKKKTYREWKQLTNEDFRPPTPPKKNTSGLDLDNPTPIQPQNKLSREERLEQIKNKLKKIQDKETQIKEQSLDEFKKLEKEYSTPLMDVGGLVDLQDVDGNEIDSVDDIIKKRKEMQENEKNKQYLKKTIKRKFTLGKSDKLRRVSVLIKDRQTRKKIVNTQKELKKTNISDVKKYLRQHGIIKVGTTCPADILRKTFESAVLTGEVTNINKETLLHNFLLESDKYDT